MCHLVMVDKEGRRDGCFQIWDMAMPCSSRVAKPEERMAPWPAKARECRTAGLGWRGNMLK